jgi:cephalosporin hydroxylase|tara:strand:- start:1554 stop:2303 length:750 start_codon:yes stop_codon:yes gene_type:complete
MNKIKQFEREREDRIKRNGDDKKLKSFADKWTQESMMKNYVYNFSWLGRPIIQSPQDIMALQEIIWNVKPDMIIETGIAHGGSLIFSASMLTLLETCGEIENGQVLGIDIDIREHNKIAIDAHPMSKKITMFQGSSLDKKIIERVNDFAKKGKKILVCLDSNHTHEHVLGELKAYAPLVSVGSYCVVYDTVVEDMPEGSFSDRSWDKGNNPKTAVWEYLKTHIEFKIDKSIQDKLLITAAPDGFLKRIN